MFIHHFIVFRKKNVDSSCVPTVILRIGIKIITQKLNFENQNQNS